MLREATEADLGDLLRWRNDPEVRRASFTTHEITETEHRSWWAAVRHEPGRRVLIYEHHGTPAGAVLFKDHDLHSRTAMWGFYLDHDGLERTGTLLAAWLGLEREAVAYAFGRLGLRLLKGEVLAWNRPVRWMHRRCGFVEVGDYMREIDGRPQQVISIEQRSGGRPG